VDSCRVTLNAGLYDFADAPGGRSPTRVAVKSRGEGHAALANAWMP
jgi:hypothetical protein